MFGRRPSGDLVIVGLGNPGPAYARTRHNAGAMLVEALAADLGVSLARARGQMRTAQATLEGRPVVLGIPTTFMNVSGPPVAKLARKAGGAQNLVVAHDELDLPLGRVRLKDGGGTAGHNGLRSIESSLRSRDFLRVRIGIGRPGTGEHGAEKVLGKFRPEELDVIRDAIRHGIDALCALAREDLDAAQRLLHSAT